MTAVLRPALCIILQLFFIFPAVALTRIDKVSVESVTSTSAVITWVTDTPSDSQVVYGLDDGYGQSTPIDAKLVTTHSVKLAGLWPERPYWFAIRSASAKGSVWSRQDPFATKPASPDGPYDFFFTPEGPHHVTQGSNLYVQLNMGVISGKRDRVNVRVTGLPPKSTLHFPDQEDRSVCCTFDPRSGTAQLWSPERTQFEISTSPQTPVGNFILHLHFMSGSIVRNLTYPVTVDSPRSLRRGQVSSYPPIPQLRRWRDNMKQFGAKWCVQQTSPGVRCGVGAENCSWYYDGERVYKQIASYTRQPKWNKCAENSEVFYRDEFVMAANPPGAIQGWRVFPDGLYMDYIETKDLRSKAAVHALAVNSAYASLQGLISARLCRENAYKITANRLDLDLGAGPLQQARLARSVDYALGDIDQWFISKNAPWMQPFMVGLTMEALIQYYEDEHTDDSRIPIAIQVAADALWDSSWREDKGSFVYNSFYDSNHIDVGQSSFADLNLLIAPAYAWLWQYTGNPKYMAEGDQIFARGVEHAAVDWNGKIFSQNYRWSFDYIKWRTEPSQASMH